MQLIFKEKQSFKQWWLWILLTGIGTIPIIGIYKQLILEEKFGDKPMSDFGLIVFSIAIFGLMALFKLMHLKTEIDQDEIRINFFPFVKKRVLLKDIKKTEIVNYGFVGYGIRFSRKFGTIYNTNGNKGLAIELQNGIKFVIGTQNENELRKALKILNL